MKPNRNYKALKKVPQGILYTDYGIHKRKNRVRLYYIKPFFPIYGDNPLRWRYIFI